MNFIKFMLNQVEENEGDCTTSQTTTTEETIADPEENFHITEMCVQLNARTDTPVRVWHSVIRRDNN